MDLKDVQQHLDKIMLDQNNRIIPEFEGYSPFEMHQILHFTFGPDCPVQLKKLKEEEYRTIPILNQVKCLAGFIAEARELTLTKTGNLPVKIVAGLYANEFIKDEYIESGITKLYKETDSLSVHLTRVLMEVAGLIKKRNGKMSLTKASGKYLANDHDLLKLLLSTYGSRLNLACFDGYGDSIVGQLGYGFSLVLLSKYGHQNQLASFYAEKYFNAFPQLLKHLAPRYSYSTVERIAENCYSLRVLEKFADFFGLITVEKKGSLLDQKRDVKINGLFDKLIECHPHQWKDIPKAGNK
jgi:hypothetical protein